MSIIKDPTARVAVAITVALIVLTVALSGFAPKYWSLPYFASVFTIEYALFRQWRGPGAASPSAFMGIAWLGWIGAQLARQWDLELTTARHLTTLADSCAGSGALVTIGWIGLAMGVTLISLPFLIHGAPRVTSRAGLAIAACALLAGAYSGYATWADWQINRPCL